jgi:lambda family phage portal protein
MPATATGDAEIRFDIQALRDRSRQLERADPLMKRFLNCLEKNVLKSGVGFSFQSLVNNPDGSMDFLARQKIEAGWEEWSRPQNCTLNGEEGLPDVLRLALRSTGRDGGIMLRKIRDPGMNKFGFALRFLEIDLLDVNYNTILPGGNRVIMGVEKNGNDRTVAFHILNKHPGDLLFGSSPRDRIRVNAEDIIHYFVKERVTQCVGVPWAAPSMLRMHHLEQYELSELIASRAAANKGGYFTSERGDKYAGENEQTTAAAGTEDTGATLSQSEPGQSDELPPGMSFVPYNPTHPTQQFGDFVQASKLSIAAGLDMSYATLVGDLTKSSFSSMRTGWLDERETYKRMQAHMIAHLVTQIFEAWLEMALTTQAVRLPMFKFDQFNKPNFRGRRWPWIDPEKDIRAALMENGAGLKTKGQIIDESDSELDHKETIDHIAEEQAYEKKKGVVLVNAAAPIPPDPTQQHDGANPS